MAVSDNGSTVFIGGQIFRRVVLPSVTLPKKVEEDLEQAFEEMDAIRTQEAEYINPTVRGASITHLGDSDSIDLGDGVFTGREPHISQDSSETVQRTRYRCCYRHIICVFDFC